MTAGEMNVRMSWKDALAWLARQEGGVGSRELAAHFGVSLGRACTTLERLRLFGSARMAGRRGKGRLYVATSYGRKLSGRKA